MGAIDKRMTTRSAYGAYSQNRRKLNLCPQVHMDRETLAVDAWFYVSERDLAASQPDALADGGRLSQPG